MIAFLMMMALFWESDNLLTTFYYSVVNQRSKFLNWNVTLLDSIFLNSSLSLSVICFESSHHIMERHDFPKLRDVSALNLGNSSQFKAHHNSNSTQENSSQRFVDKSTQLIDALDKLIVRSKDMIASTSSTQRTTLKLSCKDELKIGCAERVLYIMNIPRDGKCSHANNPHPLLCISTSAETSNSIKVNVPDQWNQLGRRMISALPEIAAKYHADWLFKLDPDTTVYPSRLEAALNTS